MDSLHCQVPDQVRVSCKADHRKRQSTKRSKHGLHCIRVPGLRPCTPHAGAGMEKQTVSHSTNGLASAPRLMKKQLLTRRLTRAIQYTNRVTNMLVDRRSVMHASGSRRQIAPVHRWYNAIDEFYREYGPGSGPEVGNIAAVTKAEEQ